MRRLLLALPALMLALPLTAKAQDAAAGEALFKQQCAACHRFDRNVVGPQLGGVFGRPSAGIEGFRYSAPMRALGVTWNEETLARYLRNPKEMVPGGTMSFVGVKDEAKLANLLAFLRAQSPAP